MAGVDSNDGERYVSERLRRAPEGKAPCIRLIWERETARTLRGARLSGQETHL
jgi:hypothetical protein